jgi:hypothetical protein
MLPAGQPRGFSQNNHSGRLKLGGRHNNLRNSKPTRPFYSCKTLVVSKRLQWEMGVIEVEIELEV